MKTEERHRSDMKKPKITGGKWKVSKRGINRQYIAELGTIMVISDGDPDETAEADAKAISQVPNMIDALIEAYNKLDECDGSGVVKPMMKTMMQIEQVLLDAGCEL